MYGRYGRDRLRELDAELAAHDGRHALAAAHVLAVDLGRAAGLGRGRGRVRVRVGVRIGLGLGLGGALATVLAETIGVRGDIGEI